MRIVIVGAGEVGHHLADILSREEHRVTIVDSDASKAQRLVESLDVQVLVGDGTRAELLPGCGASKADLVIAVTNNDYVNMLACMVSHGLGARRLILRLKDDSRLAGYRYFYKRSLGFDVVLSTEALAAEEILNTVREQNALEVETFAEGRVQLRRLRLKEESELTEGPLADTSVPSGTLIVAVQRRERFFVPAGDDQLAVDDQVYVIGRGSDLDAFERRAGAPARSRRSVVLMGAGDVGRRIASRLVGLEDVSLRVIETNAEQAQALAAEVQGDMMVLVGDATDLNLLQEERIGDANIFVATSGDDERNMMACQLARSLGVERTIAMVNKPSYHQIYDLLGIDRAISPRILCANRILRFVRSESVSTIAVIGEGRAEVLELEAHFANGKNKRKSLKVRHLGLPRGSMIGAIVRGEEVLIPSGESSVVEGDHVILFTLPDNLEQVEGFFHRISETGRD